MASALMSTIIAMIIYFAGAAAAAGCLCSRNCTYSYQLVRRAHSAQRVPTTDGFLLGVQNIPYGVAGPRSVKGPPVLLMHGVAAAGDNYVLNGPQRSLGFILADAGFDVYIGNNRNVQWSHGSYKYNPLERGYWDWTADELAAFDIPAMVGYIYNRTGGSKVFYVGHSQGTTLILAGLTGRGLAAQQMKNILRGVVLMAPVAYVSNISPPFTRVAIDIYADEISPLIGVGPADYRLIFQTVCAVDINVCTDVLVPGILGTNNYLGQGANATYLKYYPQPTSSYNLNQVGQVKRSREFKEYDRGPLQNLARYGQIKPPFYNLTKFPSASFPQLFFKGGVDQLGDPTDAARLLRELPDAGNRRVVTLPDYGHLDFIAGLRSYLDVYPQIVSFFQAN